MPSLPISSKAAHVSRELPRVRVCAPQGHVPKAGDAFGISNWRTRPPNITQETEALYRSDGLYSA